MTSISPGLYFIILSVFIWQLTWKGIGLWRAAKNHQKKWFIALIALLYINDLGIISIIFLFRFAKQRLTINEIAGWIKKVRHYRKK